MVSAVAYYGGDEGWVITSSIFTPSAKALAQKTNIRLIDGKMLTGGCHRLRGRTWNSGLGKSIKQHTRRFTGFCEARFSKNGDLRYAEEAQFHRYPSQLGHTQRRFG